MKMSVKPVPSSIERVDPKYWDKSLLHSNIFTTTFPRRNVFETNSGLRGQRSENTPFSHGTASLDVRVYWLLKRAAQYTLFLSVIIITCYWCIWKCFLFVLIIIWNTKIRC